MKGVWYVRKDKTHVLKIGRYKVLEIFKRPHGSYCCIISTKGSEVWCEGYLGTSLPTFLIAKNYGLKKAKELNIIK